MEFKIEDTFEYKDIALARRTRLIEEYVGQIVAGAYRGPINFQRVVEVAVLLADAVIKATRG